MAGWLWLSKCLFRRRRRLRRRCFCGQLRRRKCQGSQAAWLRVFLFIPQRSLHGASPVAIRNALAVSQLKMAAPNGSKRTKAN